MTIQIRFSDPEKMIVIPALDCEDVSAVEIAAHVRPYVQRREPKWHVEMGLFMEDGVIRLRKRDITFRAYRI